MNTVQRTKRLSTFFGGLASFPIEASQISRQESQMVRSPHSVVGEDKLESQADVQFEDQGNSAQKMAQE